MITAVFIYAGSDLVIPKIGHFAQIVFILTGLSMILAGISQKSLRVPTILLFLTIPIQISSWYFAPEIAGIENENYPRLDRLGRWFIFLFVGYWLIGQRNFSPILWLCFIIGLILSPFLTGKGFDEIISVIGGNRVDFGLRNAQHTGMFFGVAIVGLYSFMLSKLTKPSPQKLTLILLLLLLSACTLGLIASQTRGAWLSVGVGVIISSVLTLVLALREKRSNNSKNKYTIFITISILIVSIFLLFCFAPKERFMKESTSIGKFIDGEIRDMKNDNVGIRVKSWASALPWISERPIIGWGRMGSPAVIKHSGYLPSVLKPGLGHLHNSYLDITVQYGILGLLIFFALIIWLLVFSWKSYKMKKMPTEVFVFIASFLGYWVAINTTESYMLYSSGRFVLNLVVGGALAFHLNSIKLGTKK
mgnify:CR=1 FL=1